MPDQLVAIGKAAKSLSLSIDTLRRWDKTGRLQSVRSGPRGHRFYRASDLAQFVRNDESETRRWAAASVGFTPPDTVYCQTRDVFQSRLEHVQAVLMRTLPLSIVSLIIAVAGEIGNNSFDHNLGNWPDIMGVFFSYDAKTRTIFLADRGQGILKTLRRVKPALQNSFDALHVAFTETISGRQPEARGNGLKFVRSIIIENPFTLYFQTGNACVTFRQGDRDISLQESDDVIPGCFAILRFEDVA